MRSEWHHNADGSLVMHIWQRRWQRRARRARAVWGSLQSALWTLVSLCRERDTWMWLWLAMCLQRHCTLHRPRDQHATRVRTRIPYQKNELHRPTTHPQHESVDCKRLAAARLSRLSCAPHRLCIKCTSPRQILEGRGGAQKKLSRGGQFCRGAHLPALAPRPSPSARGW